MKFPSKEKRGGCAILPIRLRAVSLFVSHHLADILPYDIELQIHDRSFRDLAKIRIIVRIRDDRYLEAIIPGIANRQAHAVHAHGTLLHGHVTLPGLFFIERVLERVVPASIRLAHLGTDGGLVDVPLHDMSVQPSVHQHATLQVHLIPYFQTTQIRAFQRLLDSGHRIGIVRHAHYRQAHAVMRHALIYFQLIHERAPHRQVEISFIRLKGHHLGRFLYYS